MHACMYVLVDWVVFCFVFPLPCLFRTTHTTQQYLCSLKCLMCTCMLPSLTLVCMMVSQSQKDLAYALFALYDIILCAHIFTYF